MDEVGSDQSRGGSRMLVAATVGVVIGAAAMYLFLDARGIRPTIREGEVYTDADTSSIGFFPYEGFGESTGYTLAGAEWYDGISWHQWSTDNCLEPTQSHQPVRLGVLTTEPTHDAGAGRDVVVWFECLDR